MRKGLLGLAAGATIAFGALTYSDGEAIVHLRDRNPDLAHFWDVETDLRIVNDTYVNLSLLEQMRQGSDYPKRYTELLTERNKLLDNPAIQEDIKREKKHIGGILGYGSMTALSMVVGIAALLSKKKKSE